MPELKSPYEITNSFTSQYDIWASKIQKDKRNTQGVWFNTDSGSIYIRNMARGILSDQLVVCVATVNINKEYQNKGILSSFIKYIQKNPYGFSEIEVENISSEELLNSFISKGFKATTDIKYLETMPLTVAKVI